jgi:hypothetical protein
MTCIRDDGTAHNRADVETIVQTLKTRLPTTVGVEVGNPEFAYLLV